MTGGQRGLSRLAKTYAPEATRQPNAPNLDATFGAWPLNRAASAAITEVDRRAGLINNESLLKIV